MAKQKAKVTKPSEVDSHVGWFDRFAEKCSNFTGRALFFTLCILLIVIWAPTFVFLSIDTWQLIINTITTCITFLMVALLQNSQTRSNNAIQHKLNAIAEAMATMMDHMEQADGKDADMESEADELRQAVGLEYRESTS